MTSGETLAGLLHYLKAADYRFVTVTPATHALVLARHPHGPITLRDIFGWNRVFEPDDLNPAAFALLDACDALDAHGGKFRSKVRAASLGEDLFLHSAFPTDSVDSVFFGPDTYRFTRFVAQQLPRLPAAKWLVDMGTGSGAGAVAAARSRTSSKITMIDTNPAALELAAINAGAAGVRAETLLSDGIPWGADLVIANPPYLIDGAGRSYRDGGGLLGGEVSLEWARQALERLAPGGTLLLYTGAAYRDGQAPLISGLESACAERGATIELGEIDADVFGEELEQPCYQEVERIAAVGVVIRTAAA